MFKEIKRRFNSDKSEDIQWVVNAAMITMGVVVAVLILFFIMVKNI